MASAAVAVSNINKQQSNRATTATTVCASQTGPRFAELSKLDPVLQAAFADIPDEPYIVSAPSDRPYTVPEELKDNWRIRGFFDRSEKRLQYQTLKWMDMSDTVLQLSAMHEEKARHGAAGANKPSSAIVRTATPVGVAGGPKKKMTLGDYKNRTKVEGGDAAQTSAMSNGTTATAAKGYERQVPGSTQRDDEAARASCNMMVEEALKKSDLLTVANPATPPAPFERQSRNGGVTKSDKTIQSGSVRAPRETSPGKRKRADEPIVGGQRHPSPKRSKSESTDHKDRKASVQSHAARKAQSDTIDDHQEKHYQAAETPPSSMTTKAPWPTPRPSASARNSSQPAAPAWFGEEVKTESSLPTPPQHEDKPPPEPRDIPTWLTRTSWDDRSTPPRLPDDFRLIDRHPRAQARARQQMVRAGHALSPPQSASSPDTVRMSLTYSSNSSIGGDRSDEQSQDMTLKSRIDGKARPTTINRAADVPNRMSDTTRSDATVRHDKMTKQDDLKVREASADSEAEKLIVKLKIPRALRADVQRLLKLKSVPRPSPRPTSAPKLSNDEVSADRRPNTHLTVPPLKRQKSGSSDIVIGPSTPRLNTLTSSPHARSTPASAAKPSASVFKPKSVNTSTSKTSSTPAAVDTKRPETPARTISAKATDTPGSSTFPTTNTTRPAPPDASKWHTEHTRLRSLGRVLKSKMKENAIPLPNSALLPPTPSSSSTTSTITTTATTSFATSQTHHLAALHGIESLLAFMLALLAHDRALPTSHRHAISAFHNFASTPPYAREVVAACAPWPHLCGMAQLLRAACEGVVVSSGARGEVGLQASKEKDKPEHELEALRKKDKQDTQVLLSAIEGVQAHAAEAARLLPREVMRREYGAAARAVEAGVVPGGVGVEPKAAVRAGLAFLRGWTSVRGQGRDVGWVGVVDEGCLGDL